MKNISIRSLLVGGAVASFVIAALVAAVTLWDVFFSRGRQVQFVDTPGFHVLDLETTGLYAGIYRHTGSGPIPVEPLSRLDIRVTSKETYEEIPVLMNQAGQTFGRLGMRGMVLFNFLVDKPGFYTLSALYAGDTDGPKTKLMLVPQSAANVGPTLLAGTVFFCIFVGLGIFLILKNRRHSMS